jgi:hypothetical protein
MYRFSSLVLIVAATAVTWSESQAAGSFQRPPVVITAGVATPVPTISAGDLVGGCGRGRVRDSQTHACRGPADIR